MNVQKNTSESEQPTLCVCCQTFYGSPSNKGMCSTCFKKGNDGKKQEANVQVSEKIEESSLVQNQKLQKEQKPQEKQIDRKRCFTCSKKLGLLGTECKCSLVFCNSHRLPQNHSCEFNFKQQGQKRLQKTVVKVSNGKINQI